jgi:hypothetical protein
MLDSKQLRELIIIPALEDLQIYSEDAVELLVFTCAVESEGGTYLHQIKGPALGIYQMEPATYNDIWANYILLKSELSTILFHNFDVGRMPSEDRLIYDLRYATAMARLFYRRVSEALPNHNRIDDVWEYYKKYWNTYKGKAEYHTSINAYHRFIERE